MIALSLSLIGLASAFNAPAPALRGVTRAAATKMAFVDSLCAAPVPTYPAPAHGPSPRAARAPYATLTALGLWRARREGTGEETGGTIWDPLDIADSVSDEAVMWFRHAELKHGRVSMVRASRPAEIAGRAGSPAQTLRSTACDRRALSSGAAAAG